MNPRRHLCAACETLVDVTGLRRVGTDYRCRVTNACRVRATRAKRTAPRDEVPWGEDAPAVVSCRFCGHHWRDAAVRPCAMLVPMKDGTHSVECRSVGACEKRMVKGTR